MMAFDPNTPDNLIRWIRFRQAVKPGTDLPDMGIPEAGARDIAAYLLALGHRERDVGGPGPRPESACSRHIGLLSRDGRRLLPFPDQGTPGCAQTGDEPPGAPTR